MNNNKGKSGGCRVIYYFKNDKGEIVLLLGYAKNVQTDLTQKQIKILANIVNDYYK